MLATASLGGLWIVRAVAPGKLPLRWHLLLGASLGIGALSLLVLGFGLIGWLNARLWYGVLSAAGIMGLVRLATLLRPDDKTAGESAGSWRWLWLTAVPFAVLAALAAAVPPGLLWAQEGGGYDVLEYHLQMPREYFEAGRISYAPHNVYANFPANAEMLYLLCMVLRGDAIQAAGTAQMVNVGLAALVVATGWLIGRERSPRAGVVTGVVTAGIGWLIYLSGVAYVENAMLFFGLMAAAVLVRAYENDGQGSIRWTFMAGLLAGLAAGCKYTGAVLVVVPLAILAAGLPGLSLKRRIAGLSAYAFAAALAVCPWLIKNAAMTGNPVFPLLGSVFPSCPDGWGESEYRHFAACHLPGPEERSPGSRLGLLWRHVLADPDQRIGLPLMLLALAGLASWEKRGLTIVFALVLAVQLLMWMFGTHLYARFAVPLLIPLIVLTSNVGRPGRWVLATVVAGMALNVFFTGRLYAAHLYADGRKLPVEGLPELFLHGKVRGYEFYEAVNTLPADARVLLVGEARAFYFRRAVDYRVVFNRNPFVEAVRSASSEAEVIAWLRRRGFTHVLVNWREIARLRRSRYGFADEITQDLFDQLGQAGLTPAQTITDLLDGRPYAELYRL